MTGEEGSHVVARSDEAQGAASQAAIVATARWRTAEAHLYPLIMSDPELYELALTLVVEARDVLRSECATVSALVESDAEAVLTRCPSRSAVREQGFDTLTAFDAARAQRFRELP